MKHPVYIETDRPTDSKIKFTKVVHLYLALLEKKSVLLISLELMCIPYSPLPRMFHHCSLNDICEISLTGYRTHTHRPKCVCGGGSGVDMWGIYACMYVLKYLFMTSES